ncbi:hypothetical protein BRD17_02505 [Halobacteriales archaeon SW_7_68_16]|nr:MAG: hypothetical protein BRD17_02505 [Halobacteriales archaeon SW_7_68_16]
MEAFGVRLVVAPAVTARTLLFVAAGVSLGTVSGLTPGLHANNFALLLAAVATDVPGPPGAIGAAVLAAGIVHTFLDVVPALALGVPDASMAASALPAHELVLEGRGREAIRLSAVGSGLAVALAVPLAVPVTAVMTTWYPLVVAWLPAILAAVVLALIAIEPTVGRRLGAAVVVALAAGLGVVALDHSPDAIVGSGSVLTPLFAGLFGAPVLLYAVRGSGVPPQDDADITVERRGVGTAALLGGCSGAVVGYLPGVSAGVAGAFALAALPGGGNRAYVVATSGVNTANTVFALFALAALGDPRTGVLVAFDRIGAPLNLPGLLVTVGLAAACGVTLVLVLGDRYLAAAGRVDQRRLSAALLCLLAGLSGVFAGIVGVLVFVVAAAIGLVPIALGVRRVHLMAVLTGPIALGV